MMSRNGNHFAHNAQPRPAAVVDCDHRATGGNCWQLKSSNYRNHNVAVFRNGTRQRVGPQRALAFCLPHPGSQTAAAEVHQPGSPAAAVNTFRSARALPPAHPSLGAPSLAEASQGASAFSSELPVDGDRQVVAAMGSALVATADPFSDLPAIRRKQSALRVAAASVIAEQQPSISTSGV